MKTVRQELLEMDKRNLDTALRIEWTMPAASEYALSEALRLEALAAKAPPDKTVYEGNPFACALDPYRPR